VGPDRTGGTVRLDVGDRLVLDLGANYAVPSGQLPGVSYPHDLLAFSAADVRVGRYVFTGRAKGMAKISVLSPNCRPGPVVGDPGATPAAPAGVRCPLLGPEGGPSPPRSSGGPAIPSWFFTLTVLIS